MKAPTPTLPRRTKTVRQGRERPFPPLRCAFPSRGRVRERATLPQLNFAPPLRYNHPAILYQGVAHAPWQNQAHPSRQRIRRPPPQPPPLEQKTVRQGREGPRPPPPAPFCPGGGGGGGGRQP